MPAERERDATRTPPHPTIDADLEGQTLVTQIVTLRKDVTRLINEMSLDLSDPSRPSRDPSEAAVELAQVVKGAIVHGGTGSARKLLRPSSPPLVHRDAA